MSSSDKDALTMRLRAAAPPLRSSGSLWMSCAGWSRSSRMLRNAKPGASTMWLPLRSVVGCRLGGSRPADRSQVQKDERL
jgi:hypothetical protein